MIRLVRIFGCVLMALGLLVILTWLIEPLRKLWPFLIDWFQSMPTAIQVGLAVGAVGFLLLMSSVIWERIEDSKKEGSLLDNDD